MDFEERSLIYLPETDSTNRYLQTLLASENLADETLVWTDFQTAGRGQLGNSWESEGGKNLMFSLLFYPNRLSANQLFVIAELAALCVKRVLDKIVSGITVKWPNDIYWCDRKIAGILIENTLSGGFISRSIIGVGLNINQEQFCSDAPNPVSLKQITGTTYDRMNLLEQLRLSFHALREQLEAEGLEVIHREYLQVLYRREGFHLFHDANGTFEACIRHVELSGHLSLERVDKTISRYAFKEVTYL